MNGMMRRGRLKDGLDDEEGQIGDGWQWWNEGEVEGGWEDGT